VQIRVYSTGVECALSFASASFRNEGFTCDAQNVPCSGDTVIALYAKDATVESGANPLVLCARGVGIDGVAAGWRVLPQCAFSESL
jgi:hypothetical protein